jgi:hypothetical protein
LLINRSTDSLSQEEEVLLGGLLSKKQDILALEESKWRLKSRVVWLQEGNNNTNFFHSYENHHKNLILIVEIENVKGQKVSSFEDITKAVVDYFSSLFLDPPGCPILETLKVIDLIPRKINVEINESFQDDI